MFDWKDLTKQFAELEKIKYPVSEFKIGQYTCYVTKNKIGGWVAYIDVTDFPELHSTEFDTFDSVLPFHGGCTFCRWTSGIGTKTFANDRFLIGCDWCHDGINFTSNELLVKKCGIEDATEEEVKDNLKHVVEMMAELRLKMTIKGKGHEQYFKENV